MAVKRTVRLAALGPALLFTAITPALAGSFSVDPVRVVLSEGRPVATVVVRNNGSEATVVQLETSSWSQRDGRDILRPTDDFLATPPIFTIAPGDMQTLRAGLRRAFDPQRELAYRLILREVPARDEPLQGLRVALAISMPVFALPPRPVEPRLLWRVLQKPDGSVRLLAGNVGDAHVKLGRIELSFPSGDEVLTTQKAAGYVLPMSRRDWILKGPAAPAAPGAIVSIVAGTEDGDVLRAEVELEDEQTLPAAGVDPGRR